MIPELSQIELMRAIMLTQLNRFARVSMDEELVLQDEILALPSEQLMAAICHLEEALQILGVGK